MIQINPLQSYIDGGARAAITSPPSASLVFDLPGRAIWVKGVKLKGTDHIYTFSHDDYISITNTPDQNDPESEDIQIEINTPALKSAIDTTYGLVSSTANGLAPMYTSSNLINASAATTYYFLGISGNALKWYRAPWRNIKVETTEVLGVNDTDPLTISAGNGISVNWDSTNKKVVITNTESSNNTDYQVTQDNINSNNNDYRLLLKYSANDTAETTIVNFAPSLTYNPSTKELKVNSQKVIHTGNITSANATIGDVLTTLATFEGVEIKANIDSSSIISSYLSQWDITADKASFELTQEWTDSGVGLSGLSPGPCLLYINYCGVHYTGIFAYSGTTINTDDEFPLHCSGYTQLDRGRIFAKIAAVQGATKLMLAAQKAETNIPLFTIKIKQIAIL